MTDAFGFFVDGVNYASFEDGSLVSFEEDANAGNLIESNFSTGNYDFEYDGFSTVLKVTTIFSAAVDTHAMLIAIADTDDSIFDIGVFISGLSAAPAREAAASPRPPSRYRPPAGCRWPGLAASLAWGVVARPDRRYIRRAASREAGSSGGARNSRAAPLPSRASPACETGAGDAHAAPGSPAAIV